MEDVIFVLDAPNQHLDDNNSSNEIDPANTSGPEGITKIRIKACSQVMANASPYFKAMFDGTKFKEGHNLKANGICETELPETDVEAFTVLCNMLHLRSNQVTSHEMTAELLYNIAKLVDMYDCFTAIKPWTQLWGLKFTQIITSKISRMRNIDILKWVYICGVLQFEETFEQLTARFLGQVTSKQLNNPEFKKEYDRLTPATKACVEYRFEECRDSMIYDVNEVMQTLKEKRGCRHHEPDHNCSSALYKKSLSAYEKSFGRQWDMNSRPDNDRDLYKCTPHELSKKVLTFAKNMEDNGWNDLLRQSFAYHKHCYEACIKDVKHVNWYADCVEPITFDVITDT